MAMYKMGRLWSVALTAGMAMGCSVEDPPKKPAISAKISTGTTPGGGGDATAKKSPTTPTTTDDMTLVAQNTFSSSAQSTTSVNWVGDYVFTTNDITMTKQRTEKTLYFTQSQRSFVNDAYTQSAAATQGSFAISRDKADLSDVRVVVNGASVSPTAYSFNLTAMVVVFKTPPAAGASILIYYKLLTNPNTFMTSTTADPKSVQVYINNVLQSGGYQFNSSTGEVVFPTAPADGYTIKIIYVDVGAPILSYSLLVPDSAVKNLTVFQKNNPQVVYQVTYQQNQVVFAQSDFTDGMVVEARYYNSASGQVLTLDHTPVAGTVKFNFGTSGCTIDEFTVTDTTITSACVLPADTPISVSYQYVSVYFQSFSMADKMPTQPGEYVWQVWVGGVQRTDFTQSGSTVAFATKLPVMQDVLIKIYQKSAS